MKKNFILCFLIIMIGVIVSGCRTQYQVVMLSNDYNEVYKGQSIASRTTGRAYLELKSEVTETTCSGYSYVTYIPSGSFNCIGLRGKIELKCDDGRIISLNYGHISSCANGIATGYDQQGNRFTFAFGITEAEALEYVRNEVAVAAFKPDLPPVYQPKEVRKKKGFSTGTGFFVTSDGYLITNYHVVEDSQYISIITVNDKEYEAELVNGDPVNDVVLLKVNAKTKPLTLLQQCNLAKGEEVFTLGYPLIMLQGQEQKATFGRVNSLSGIQGDIRFIQIDVPVQPGNSGGPLINDKGQVVGVVTATLNELVALQASGHLPQSVNYAVKSDYIVPLLKYSLGDKISKQAFVGAKRSFPDLVKLIEPSVVFVIAK